VKSEKGVHLVCSQGLVWRKRCGGGHLMGKGKFEHRDWDQRGEGTDRSGHVGDSKGVNGQGVKQIEKRLCFSSASQGKG